MEGEEDINKAVNDILTDTTKPHFTVWKQRHKLNKLSLSLRISIIEHHSNKTVSLTINNPNHERPTDIFPQF